MLVQEQAGKAVGDKDDEEDEGLAEDDAETVAELGFEGQILNIVLEAGQPWVFSASGVLIGVTPTLEARLHHTDALGTITCSETY